MNKQKNDSDGYYDNVYNSPLDNIDSDGRNEEGFTVKDQPKYGDKDYEAVNHPRHYNTRKLEVIEIIKIIVETIKNPFHAYLISNIVKYICRYDTKGKPVEDLKKAKWYLERLIKDIENS